MMDGNKFWLAWSGLEDRPVICTSLSGARAVAERLALVACVKTIIYEAVEVVEVEAHWYLFPESDSDKEEKS